MTDPPTAAASLESRILALLVGVAPDIDPASVSPQLDFRDQFDFDSMDLFNFAASIHESFGIDIPERDYRSLAGLAKCATYLKGKLPPPGVSGSS
jgi:acyl carrier protein